VRERVRESEKVEYFHCDLKLILHVIVVNLDRFKSVKKNFISLVMMFFTINVDDDEDRRHITQKNES
jgi:hypothetical protein